MLNQGKEKRYMKTFNSVLVALAVLALTACGSQTSRSVTSGGALTGASGSSGSSSSGEDTTGNINNLPQAPSQVVTVSGNSGTYPTVSFRASTSRTLKVKVTAMSAPNLVVPGATNWVFPYGCMQVTVSANGMTLTTQVLRVGTQGGSSTCANAPTYQVLDFTNAMTGSGSALITISNPQYDNCRAQSPLAYGCGMSAVWSNHLVSTNITTQVDGTWMDP